MIADNKESDEVIDTPEMVFYLEEIGEIVKEQNMNTVTGSMDAENMYNMLDVDSVAAEAGRRVRESSITFEGVDYEWAGRYIAMS